MSEVYRISGPFRHSQSAEKGLSVRGFLGVESGLVDDAAAEHGEVAF